MGWFSWITGGGKVAEKAMDMASAGLDMAFFTNEEKSIANLKVLDWKLAYLQATSAQNVTRRVIALVVTGLWCGLLLLAVLSKGLGHEDFSNFVFSVLGEHVNTLFGIIVGFYFLAHVVRGAKK